MKLPQKVKIKTLADGKSLGNMFVRIAIKTTQKNDFGLGFGPSDDEGHLVILREHLIDEAEKERKLFLMDYGDPEKDSSGALVITPLSPADIEKAISAFQLYKDVSSFPLNYSENLRKARDILNKLNPATLGVEVNCDGLDVSIQTLEESGISSKVLNFGKKEGGEWRNEHVV